MIPNIARIRWLATYRDGGSMSVSFECNSGTAFTLMFPVNFGPRPGGRFEVLGYHQPVLEHHISIERVSPVTGLVNHDVSMEAEPATWEDARAILQKLEPLLDAFVTDFAYVYPAMVAVANEDGNCAPFAKVT